MDIIILVLVFTYLIIASISDIKTQEVPDFLNYSFIILGVFIYLTKTIMLEDSIYIFSNLITIVAFFFIGSLMYFTKQWGGADSKLLMGVGSLIPIYPSIILDNFLIKTSGYFGIDLFLNLLIVGAFYGLILAFYLMIKNRKKFIKELKKFYGQKNIKIIEKIIWITIILINILSFFLSDNNIQRILVFGISLILLVSYYLIISIKSIEKIFTYKDISTKKLRPGDYITKELKINKKIIFKPIVHGVEKNQIKDIQKHFKKVPIRDGIAFIPAFLITTIITLLKGNMILYLLP